MIEMMKRVRLLTSRATAEGINEPGDIVEVSPEEYHRLVSRLYAEPVGDEIETAALSGAPERRVRKPRKRKPKREEPSNASIT